ncbi:MAG: histidine ammonia-lyase [Eubacteriales bacterium]|nr:histidine ammonia-lyase [Eubacteriales bacterium]
MRPKDIRDIHIDGNGLSLEELVAVARFNAKVSIRPEAIKAMAKSRQTVVDILEKEKPVYGINTGFGALSQVGVSKAQAGELQNNLILSHAVGCGDPLPTETVRAMLLLRANALCKGHSGIRPEIVETLVNMLNSGVHPVIPEKGSLGASGDLAPLSHMALVLLGLGEAEYKGEILPGKVAMERVGLDTFSLQGKEGLALINGTQCMAAIGALALYDCKNLCIMADVISSLSVEALQGQLSAFDERVHELRPHRGQKTVAQNLRLLLDKSANMDDCQGLRVQDAYALRCIPQVHGAVRQAVWHTEEILNTEFNSVTDNPLIFADDGDVISGGNFHGEPLALCLDYLGIAAAELANISERRLERMVNPKLSNGLPPFLVEDSGVNSGLMIVQYAAASMVSDNKVLAHPDSVDSIPSSANQEDHVSMGTNAARHLRMIVENTFNVLALELFAACQAAELRHCHMSPVNTAVFNIVRERIAFIEHDRELRCDVIAAQKLIREETILDSVLNICPKII